MFLLELLTGVDLGLRQLFSDLVSGAGPAGAGLALGVLFLLLSPLMVLIALYIGAGIYHLLVLLFVRPNGTDFEATLRIYSYTSVVALLDWMPVIGILASLYGLYLAFVGVREMHETSNGRALAVILLPAAFFVYLLLDDLQLLLNT